MKNSLISFIKFDTIDAILHGMITHFYFTVYSEIAATLVYFIQHHSYSFWLLQMLRSEESFSFAHKSRDLCGIFSVSLFFRFSF